MILKKFFNSTFFLFASLIFTLFFGEYMSPFWKKFFITIGKNGRNIFSWVIPFIITTQISTGLQKVKNKTIIFGILFIIVFANLFSLFFGFCFSKILFSGAKGKSIFIPITSDEISPFFLLVESINGSYYKYFILLGIILSPIKNQNFQNYFGSIAKASNRIMNFFVNYILPFLIVGIITNHRNRFDSGYSVDSFFLVFVGLLFLYLIHFSFLLILLKIKKFSSFEFIKAIAKPSLIGFSTMSSSLTMPITIEKTEDICKNKEIPKIFLPFASNTHLSGTFLSFIMTLFFFGKIFFGVEITNMQFFKFFLICIPTCFCFCGVHGGAIFTLIAISQEIFTNFSNDFFILLLVMDQILDAFQTAYNIICNMFLCVFMDKFIHHNEK